MLGVDRILVAVEDREDAVLVLEKAKQLAQAADAALEVVRVIYEGFVDLDVHEVEHSQELKTFIMQAEETFLEELVEPIIGSVKSIETATIWHRDHWHGMIDAAVDCQADLIIKAANVEEGFGAIVHTPQDWNLLRHSPIPVMLVKPSAWVAEPVVLAAIDPLNEAQEELNKRVLAEADHLTKILGGELHVVTAYPFAEPWMGPVTVALDFEKVKREVEDAIKLKVDDLTRGTDIEVRYVVIEEGKPSMVIKQLIETTNAEMLVLGTVARSGVKGFVLGNTAETIIHYTNCDAVVLK